MMAAPLPASEFRASRYNPFAGTATGCHVTFAKVAGFRKDPDRKTIQDYTLSMWLGEALAGEPALPVRLEADTPWAVCLAIWCASADRTAPSCSAIASDRARRCGATYANNS